MTFSLNDIDVTGERTLWAQLYDCYKINMIKIEWIPRANFMPMNSAQDVNNFLFWTCIDYDDSTVPGSLQEVINYRNARKTMGYRRHKRIFRPTYSVPKYATATTSGYGPGRGWIDCASGGVVHYGLKYGAQSGGTPGGSSDYYDVITTYYVAFKYRR